MRKEGNGEFVLIGIRYLRREVVSRVCCDYDWDTFTYDRTSDHKQAETVSMTLTLEKTEVPYITLAVYKAKKKNDYFFTYAKCSPKDQFSRKTAREIVDSRIHDAEEYCMVDLNTFPEVLSKDSNFPEEYVKEAVRAVTEIIHKESFKRIKETS